jgi:hypothetical protein
VSVGGAYWKVSQSYLMPHVGCLMAWKWSKFLNDVSISCLPTFDQDIQSFWLRIPVFFE